MKTAELFNNKTVFSFEIFPPKSDEQTKKLLDELSDLQPDFISVTNSTSTIKNQGKTFQLSADIKNKYGIESVAHLPCINLSEEDAVNILDNLSNRGVENILALRGDISPDTVSKGRFNHANELISFIREHYDFNIIAACYPEAHPESKDIVDDIDKLKLKVDSGASQLITQLFLDNKSFYKFRENTRIAGINLPVEAGIMPVTNSRQIEKIVKLCGIDLPKKFLRIIDKFGDNPLSLRDAGIAYAVDQIVDLLTQGVDGIHLYTMNDSYVSKKIYEAVLTIIKI